VRGTTVRIIAGELKGRRLRYPPSSERLLRPTMQRTKESVFGMLQDEVRGAVFVDLYSGAGGVGMEALSRGAARVLFVENHPKALECLEENLRTCGIEASRAAVHCQDVCRFIHDGGLEEPSITIIYADPPYKDDIETLLELIDEKAYPHVKYAIVEHRGDLAGLARRALRWWEVGRTRRFGDTHLTFLEPRTPGGDR
jgi:16S rRNA (guanine(966)-N(2))-methyltransferase RsmD